MSKFPTSLLPSELAAMSSEEIIHMALVAQMSPYVKPIKGEDTFSSLGMDSLDKVEVVIELEDCLDVKVTDPEIDSLLTVSEWVTLFDTKRKAKAT